MNSGKTVAAGAMVDALAQEGHKVGYLKATGTSARNDPAVAFRGGAREILDCASFGYATTFPSIGTDKITQLVDDAHHVFWERGCTAVVVEIADGIYNQENKALLTSSDFRKAAPSQGECAFGYAQLKSWGFEVMALSGALTMKDLYVDETLPLLRGVDKNHPSILDAKEFPVLGQALQSQIQEYYADETSGRSALDLFVGLKESITSLLPGFKKPDDMPAYLLPELVS